MSVFSGARLFWGNERKYFTHIPGPRECKKIKCRCIGGLLHTNNANREGEHKLGTSLPLYSSSFMTYGPLYEPAVPWEMYEMFPYARTSNEMDEVLNKIATFPLGAPILSIFWVVKHFFSIVTRSLFLKHNEEIFLQIVDLGLLEQFQKKARFLRWLWCYT